MILKLAVVFLVWILGSSAPPLIQTVTGNSTTPNIAGDTLSASPVTSVSIQVSGSYSGTLIIDITQTNVTKELKLHGEDDYEATTVPRTPSVSVSPTIIYNFVSPLNDLEDRIGGELDIPWWTWGGDVFRVTSYISQFVKSDIGQTLAPVLNYAVPVVYTLGHIAPNIEDAYIQSVSGSVEQ